MKRMNLAMIAMLGLVLTAVPLRARVLFDTGPCDNGSTWIVVTTLDEKGRVTSIRGTDCSGRTWSGHCSVTQIPGDPGYPSAFYHVGTAGDWIRYNVDNAGVVNAMWGKDTEGRYWSTTTVVNVQLT